MKAVSRRKLLQQSLAVGSVVAGAGVLLGRAMAAQDAQPRVIDVVAQRFKYTPSEIHVKKGEKVVLAVKSLDMVHGMNFPELGVRADLPPGQITRVELHPTRSGTFDFLCDNFCGDGHEMMHGHLIVSD